MERMKQSGSIGVMERLVSISMLRAADKLLSDIKYLDAAIKAGEVTWEQGILKK